MKRRDFFGCTIIAGIRLLVGHVASAGELQVNGFPADADFFPIGVWVQSPARAASYKAIGINTFVGLDKGPTEAQLAALARQGMFAVAAQTSTALKSRNQHVIKAWMQDDEPDNAQPLPSGGYGTCVPANDVARRTREMKSLDPTRPVMINFGQGVANEFCAAAANATVIRGTTILRYRVPTYYRMTFIPWARRLRRSRASWNMSRVASPTS